MDEQQNLTKRERRSLKKEQKLTDREQQKKSKSRHSLTLWALVIIGLAAIVGGIAKFGAIPEDQKNNNGPTLLATIDETDHTKGSATASVTLIEYSDFQCPACGSYFPLLKQLNEDLGDQIQFVYRHFPLRQIHPNSQIASETAEAAGKQGAFWEIHDLLFVNQSSWSKEQNPTATFKGYAEEIGLDTERFLADLEASEVKNKIDNDYNGGIKAGVNATPTLFLNGIKLNNPNTYQDLKALIDETIRLNS